MSSDLRDKLEAYFRHQAPEGILAACLYGSRTRGAAARESDVDVGVVLDPSRRDSVETRFDLRVRLIGELVHALGEN